MQWTGGKKFLGWGLAVLALTISGDRVLARLLEHIVLRSHFRYSEVYRGGLHNDVLILGNSRGVNGFDAIEMQRRTGQNTFNASYNGVSPVLLEAIFEDYLEHNPPPHSVIIELTSVDSRQESLKDLRLYRSRSQRITILDRHINSNLARASSVLHLLDYNNPLFLRTLYYSNKSDQNWSNNGVLNAAIIASIDTMHTYRLSLPEENVAALKRMIRTAQSHKCSIRLIITPYLPRFFAKIDNFETWKAALAAAVGTSNIEDYSASLSPESDFADGVHLSVAGRRDFMNILLPRRL
jgi:hypothetical protein